MPIEASLVDGTVVIKSPLISGKTSPNDWLNRVRKKTGSQKIPGLTCECKKCRKKLTVEEIFQGFRPNGDTGIFCPTCKTINDAHLIINQNGQDRQIQLSGPNSTARQLSMLRYMPGVLDSSAAKKLYTFWTGKKLRLK